MSWHSHRSDKGYCNSYVSIILKVVHTIDVNILFCADAKNICCPANASFILVQFYTIIRYTHLNNIQTTCSDLYDKYVHERNPRIP